MDKLDPQELLQAHRSGDRQALGRYITQMADIIMHKHYYSVPYNQHDDLKQDAVLKMLESLPKYNHNRGDLFAYLYNIGKNKIYDMLNTESYRGQIIPSKMTNLDPTDHNNQAILKGAAN